MVQTTGSRSGSTRAAVAGVLGAVAAVLAVIIVVQNSESVEVEVLGWTGDAPLAVLLVAALVIGGLLGWVITMVARHRRRVAGRRSVRGT